MGDIGEIVNTTTQIFKILDNNVTTSMGKLATALPKDVDALATDGNWVRRDHAMILPLVWPAKYPELNDDDVVNLGLIWTYGGSVNGEGRYIKDAEAFATVGHISLGYTIDVSVRFADTGTPVGDEPIAMITGTFNVRQRRTLIGELPSCVIGFTLMGDGRGTMKELKIR
ncbi:hypothetical protein [Luteipulveratus mongoliensis]|uniref:Uncharacterized protein n=1 Tax=Luteipulveratus mongoliensis TaxID=571913 RepID=A0A0K1JJ38_9MICO|nr:hypothetical protein [Luteipulveratus mongoliensis]AKU16613.1 hypothetical protein VV02_13320 [Luteipulveratus mongoliensis]